MGLYDTIQVRQECPICGETQRFLFQTKDLGRNMWEFRPLSKGIFSLDFSKQMRKRLKNSPVYPKTPNDKQHTMWASQLEKRIAMAKVDEEFIGEIEYVNVVDSCRFCDNFVEGKIGVDVEGCLFGKAYDFECFKNGVE